ncbi:uncharacterized protein PODANS_1_10 [Podospora anserina S mat+]|uniref:Podospora anserina S mat+ genomic DNA chromosome 1, supercontig 1 n=1 Tax=Podospora anserina (strain S / ATCC MYA-4624 / DSM 980 / FGSC 10383) TaxID=515849 RepID=B2A9L7_PODAN|nr:uncharacterized protein PODANS_1_10 [Podospora anserina S mat+]CAP59764.1 unnamed protein product [Podospora anserina S mat+]CDP22408.1 Putative protein of unknown function [Podospora anserina S mat+]
MDTGPDVSDPLFLDQAFERLLSQASKIHAESRQQSKAKTWQKSLDSALEREMGHSHMIQLVEQLTQQVNEKLEIALHDSPTQNDSETFTKVFLKSLEGRLRCHIESSIQRALRSVPGILTTPLPWPTHKAAINQSELDESFPTGFAHYVGARPRYQIGNLTQDALGESLRYSIGGVESLSPDGLAKMNTLRKRFENGFGYDLGHDSSDWKSMEENQSNRKDSTFRRLLVRLVGKVLPVRVTYTEAERRRRWVDFVSKRPPKEVSFLVDSLVRFILALCGGALVIVPIVIMVLFPGILRCLIVTGVSVLTGGIFAANFQCHGAGGHSYLFSCSCGVSGVEHGI